MRSAFMFVALAILMESVYADNWSEALMARTNESAAVREARLSLKSAELEYRKLLSPYLPYLNLGTRTGTAVGYGSTGFSGASVNAALSLTELFGAELAISLPVTVSKDGSIGVGDPSIGLSRKLFVESEADFKDAEAALFRARSTLFEAEQAIRLQLATDIFNAVYYLDLAEANRRDLEVLERVKEATVSSTTLREIERRILQARKSILSASNALSGLDQDIKDGVGEYYAELLALEKEWSVALPDSPPPSSLAVRALELGLSAAERRRAFSLLPYLPNPSLSAELSYDVDKAVLGWDVSLSLSVNILDKGERALNALKREENAEIQRMKLESAKKALKDNVRKARENLSSLELDRKIKDLDIADEEDNVRLLHALYEGGYRSEEDLVIGQVDLSIEKLAALKIDHEILIQKIKLAQYFIAE